MKNQLKINHLLALICIFSIIVIFVVSCKKNTDDCTKCKTKEIITNSKIKIKSTEYLANVDQGQTYNQPNTTVISKTENSNISGIIIDLLSDLNLPNITVNDPISLCLFYTGEISTSNYDSLVGVLYYNKLGEQYLANLWIKNSNNNFEEIQSISGVSSIVSKSDMYKINTIKNLQTQNIFLLIDQSKLASMQYPSIFQSNIEKEYQAYAPNGGVGGNPQERIGSGPCNLIPECNSEDNGYCTFKESQNGPLSAWCNTVCANGTSVRVLNANGYDISQEQINELYKIRNEFLLNSSKGRQYIDDYYYASYYLQNNVSLSLATHLYDLYSASFFHKLSLFDSTANQNDIIITHNMKLILDQICNSAITISTDTRFNSIVNNIQADIIKYENKTLSEIKADF